MTHAWSELQAAIRKHPEKERLEQRVPGSKGPAIVLGIEAAGNKPYFVVETGFVHPPLLAPLNRFGNIQCRVVMSRDGRHDVEVILDDTQYLEVFDYFMRHLSKRLDELGNPDERFNELVSTFQTWEGLLRLGRVPLLREEEQRGLIAELLCLTDVVVPTVGTLAAARGWRGPFDAAHDFDLGTVHLEVKSYSERGTVHVSSLAQLDDDQVGHLFLYCVRLQRTSEGGFSLPQTCDEARQAFVRHRAALDLFDRALARTGYLETRREEYGFRFKVSAPRVFEVKAGFPRLQHLPPGISNVEFDLDLDVLHGFASSVEVLSQVLGGLRP